MYRMYGMSRVHGSTGATSLRMYGQTIAPAFSALPPSMAVVFRECDGLGAPWGYALERRLSGYLDVILCRSNFYSLCPEMYEPKIAPAFLDLAPSMLVY